MVAKVALAGVAAMSVLSAQAFIPTSVKLGSAFGQRTSAARVGPAMSAVAPAKVATPTDLTRVSPFLFFMLCVCIV